MARKYCSALLFSRQRIGMMHTTLERKLILQALFICYTLCISGASCFTLTSHRSPDPVFFLAATSDTPWHTDPNTMDRVSASSNGSLAALCDTTKRACFVVRPLIAAFYESLTASSISTKADSSAFTIADGILQYLLANYFFSGKKSNTKLFRAIVGEEECQVNIEQTPYTVNSMIVPPEYTELIDNTKREILLLSQELNAPDLYQNLTIFIDPIDGTKEFICGKGEDCTICIGFANENGQPVAGVVYRPLDLPWAPHLGPTWAVGAKSENYLDCYLDNSPRRCDDLLLTSTGTISPFLLHFMQQLGYRRQKSGGAGNKMLMLLEGKGSAYIQDRGLSRWDTCAAQACLEAQGGILCKLTSFLSHFKEEGYTYLESQKNLDFEKGVANMNPYNSRLPGQARNRAYDVMDVKVYSNLCGLLALPCHMNTDENKRKILEAAKSASKISAPAYD